MIFTKIMSMTKEIMVKKSFNPLIQVNDFYRRWKKYFLLESLRFNPLIQVNDFYDIPFPMKLCSTKSKF